MQLTRTRVLRKHSYELKLANSMQFFFSFDQDRRVVKLSYKLSLLNPQLLSCNSRFFSLDPWHESYFHTHSTLKSYPRSVKSNRLHTFNNYFCLSFFLRIRWFVNISNAFVNTTLINLKNAKKLNEMTISQ